MKYQAKVKFVFTEKIADEPNYDSETFEIEANSKEEASKLSYEKVIKNWDEGSIEITSVELA